MAIRLGGDGGALRLPDEGWQVLGLFGGPPG
jgi:hypothetical protein